MRAMSTLRAKPIAAALRSDLRFAHSSRAHTTRFDSAEATSTITWPVAGSTSDERSTTWSGLLFGGVN